MTKSGNMAVESHQGHNPASSERIHSLYLDTGLGLSTGIPTVLPPPPPPPRGWVGAWTGNESVGNSMEAPTVGPPFAGGSILLRILVGGSSTPSPMIYIHLHGCIPRDVSLVSISMLLWIQLGGNPKVVSNMVNRE